MKYSIEELIKHVNDAFIKSDKNESNLSQEILNIEGMSGLKTRHLYNNICNLESNYLEVGVWKGSSFISAIHKNNKTKSLAIDNWSEFYTYNLHNNNNDNNIGSKYTFLNNLENFCDNENYTVLEKSCFDVEENDLPFDTIDIYLYDGAHDYESHKKGITYFSKFLSKYSIIIVDDWRPDWETVQRGTYNGIKESNLIIHHKVERISKQEENGNLEYWNGVAVLVCEKI